MLQPVLNSGSMRLSALAYPLLVSLVAQLVCAMSFELGHHPALHPHLGFQLRTGPCGLCHSAAALSDESAERVVALDWPGCHLCVLSMSWLSVSLSIVSEPLHVVSMYIELGHGSKRTGPKGFSNP